MAHARPDVALPVLRRNSATRRHAYMSSQYPALDQGSYLLLSVDLLLLSPVHVIPSFNL